MNDEAKKLVPQDVRTGLRKFIRPAWTGAVATVIAAGVLFAASASVPAAHPSGGNDGELPIRLYGLIESIAVGETDTAPDGVTLSQIVAVLERAEEQAQEQGPDFSPTIAQAAAELGMLYTTYQMQQLAFGENNEGLRIEDAPVARGSQQAADDAADSDAADSEQDDGAAKRDGTQDDSKKRDGDAKDGTKKDADPEKNADPERGKDPQVPQPEDDVPPAVQVSNERTSVIDPHDDDPQAGYITYDEVVIAAVRLANMLDPSVPNALVEVQGQGSEQRRGFSLRENLLDVVGRFGGTTTGYANGRIPADVLCPLEFAPGHMLRCDAAERFTALSEQFEQEFGYPIPITDSYRSYELQVAVAGAKPHLAAIPGTSNHGWGLAVDLDNPIAGGNSPQYVWLRVHGPDYGWDNPSWAQLGGSKPEPWHFEFFAAGSIPNRAIDPADVGTWDPTDSTSPRYKPALDPKPKDKSDDGPRKPGSKPGDRPSDNPPSKKPTKPTPKPGDDKPDEPSKPTDPGTDPSNPTDPEPDPDPSSPTEPDPDPSDPTEPDPDPSNPTDPEPDPTDPSDPDPTDPSDPGTTDPTCPPTDGTEPDATEPDATEPDGTEPDGTDSAPADGSATETDTDEPDPCPSDGTEEPEPTPSSSAPSPTATVRDDELAPVDDQPED